MQLLGEVTGGAAGPVLKWAGGKRQMLRQFSPLFPKQLPAVYHEPFLGSGAVFFCLKPGASYLTDSSEELINFYMVLKSSVEDLILDLDKHVHTKAYYYRIRSEDPRTLTSVERASRFLYLNKCGYNGLWRVNRAGRNNVPYGSYKNPNYRNFAALRKAGMALHSAVLQRDDFEITLEQALPEDFIYCDPPYHPLSETASFRSYTAGS
ncbi:MAG: DNA adenine methylase, partial [Eubacteriales bacterium]